jgi:uncharacterized protein YbgA (DUF1722 family)
MNVEETTRIRKDTDDTIQKKEYKLTLSDYKKENSKRICKLITSEIEKQLQNFVHKYDETNKLKCEYYITIKCNDD